PHGLSGVFDPSQVDAIVLNVQMLVTNVQYVASFDNIRFTGPEVDLGGGVAFSGWNSADDSAGKLSIAPAESGSVSVSWFGNGFLQSAPAISGPWTSLSNATSPLMVK